MEILQIGWFLRFVATMIQQAKLLIATLKSFDKQFDKQIATPVST
jgi:hypothetical protein